MDRQQGQIGEDRLPPACHREDDRQTDDHEQHKTDHRPRIGTLVIPITRSSTMANKVPYVRHGDM